MVDDWSENTKHTERRRAGLLVVGLGLGVLMVLGSGALLLFEWLNCPTQYNSEGKCFDPRMGVVHHYAADVWLTFLAIGVAITALSAFTALRAGKSTRP